MCLISTRQKFRNYYWADTTILTWCDKMTLLRNEQIAGRTKLIVVLRVAIWWRLYTVWVLSDYMVRPKHDNPGDLSAVQTLQVTLFRLQYNLDLLELWHFIAVKQYHALRQYVAADWVRTTSQFLSTLFITDREEEKDEKDKAIFAGNLHRVCLEMRRNFIAV